MPKIELEYNQIKAMKAPEQFRQLTAIADDLRKTDQPGQGIHETDQMFVMRILFDVPIQETAKRFLVASFQ